MEQTEVLCSPKDKSAQIELHHRDGIFELLKAQESIPAAYVALRACTTTLFLLGS